MTIELKNQTIYKCQYCGRRKLTLKGCQIHEQLYCKNDEAPRRKNCKHDNIQTYYSHVGEGMYEPAYDYCGDCGKKLDD